MATNPIAAQPSPRASHGAAAALKGPPRPLLEWRDQWTLDVGFMDEDHRALAQRLNEIAREWRICDDGLPPANQGADPLGRLMAALEGLAVHIREHFEREEEVMRTVDYPELAAHKGEHDLLLAEFRISIRSIREAGVAGLDQLTLESMKDWLMGHVLEVDRRLAEFLKNPPELAVPTFRPD
jgi:hemerythrin-like metal-binding protein